MDQTAGMRSVRIPLLIGAAGLLVLASSSSDNSASASTTATTSTTAAAVQAASTATAATTTTAAPATTGVTQAKVDAATAKIDGVVDAEMKAAGVPGVAVGRVQKDKVSWHSCGADAPPTLECAELTVPLDYAKRHGATITIGLNRLTATDPARRIGSLIFNPGGPGGPATRFVAAEAAGRRRVFSPALRERFDVIGMDPRGVGASTPVRCDPANWNAAVSLFPRDQAAFDRLVAHNQALGESCLRLSGPLLGHVDTVSAARDLESVRAALGDGKLNYLGLSYGSQLGQTYAALFPQNIRVMALDGALNHALDPVAMLVDESSAYERAFGRFARWCAATPTCALYGEDVEARFDDLVRRAEAQPLPAPKCAETGACRPTVTGEDIRINAQDYLLFKDGALGGAFPGWAELATVLADALAGDASGLAAPVARTDTDGNFAELAIECMDWVSPITRFADLAATALLARTIAPHTRGGSQTWTIQAGCVGWPVAASNPQQPIIVSGAPPILIINATDDPSTAYPWSVGMFLQIEGSVLLTREGDGHTSYWLTGPSRTRDAIDAYLLTGTVPPPNTVYPD
jgi:pimeloyl-ACP methyl ester carboxylesterase